VPDFGSPAALKKVRILVVCKSFFNAAGGPKDKRDAEVIFARTLRAAAIKKSAND
jgi:hypothetical protein